MAYRLVDPDSNLDWQHDWSDFLSEGDSIASRLWTITPLNGTSPETPTLTSATTASVIVEGLQAGKVYHLTESITTASGIKADRTIVLRCDQR